MKFRHFSYRPKSSLHFFKKEKSHARAAQALAPREDAKFFQQFPD